MANWTSHVLATFLSANLSLIFLDKVYGLGL
jgi:hypothetical protein